jgi:glycosyltransferase
MKISIVTVTLNNAATVGDTLRSVEGQTYGDIDHVIVDGASTDETLSTVRAQGRRVSRVVSEPDGGIYDAMNKGARLASGEMIGFLNADDVLAYPGAIAAVAAAAQESAVDAVFGDLQYVDKHKPDRVVRRWHGGEFALPRLAWGWMPPHPTFYVRRTQLLSLGGFDASLKIAADYDFMLRYLARPGIRAHYVPEVLVRMRSGGASNRSIKALANKSREDLLALRRNRVGGLGTLLCKNLRKLPQFM